MKALALRDLKTNALKRKLSVKNVTVELVFIRILLCKILSISAPKNSKPNRKIGYLKMVVMEDLKFETINKEVLKSVDKKNFF